MNNINAEKFIQQGWECPKCGAILAPNQYYCPFCSKKESDWITTVGTGTQPLPYRQYVNPNPTETISTVGKTTTNAKDVDVVYTVKSYSHDGIRAIEE